MADQMEECENCNAIIGSSDEAYIWQDSVVCADCYRHLTHGRRQLGVKGLVVSLLLMTIAGLLLGHWLAPSEKPQNLPPPRSHPLRQLIGKTVSPTGPSNGHTPLPKPVIKPPSSPMVAVRPAPIASTRPKPSSQPIVGTGMASAGSSPPKVLSTSPSPPVVKAALHPSLPIHFPLPQAPVSRRSQAVIAAITRGANFLLSQQQRRWLWESPGSDNTLQFGGRTALVTEALLDVQQSLHLPQLNIFAPKMRRALNFLVRLRPHSTYVASFQANAMALLPAKARYRHVLQQDARYLIDSIHADGGYTYTQGPPGALIFARQRWDNSNTQYGVLGAWACAHAGLEMPYAYWRKAARHWRTKQYMNGAWIYSGTSNHPVGGPGMAPCNTMTPAGVASLFICDEYLYQRATINPIPHAFILRGLAWLNRHFNPQEKNFYAMYGDERVALAGGITTIAGHNWYDDFSRTLTRHRGGPWRDGHFFQASSVVATAYALLVLDRGLNPVVISKLQYGPNFFGDWNARQRDAANFTSWLSKTFETPLNWQVVNFHAPLTQWLQAPILLITGSKDPRFSRSEVAALRHYVQAGGLILSSPDGGSRLFQKAMVQYARRMVHGRYPVTAVPPTSYIYTLQPWYHFQRPPQFEALSNHIRYLWLLSSTDLGAIWQGHRFAAKGDWQVPANIYFYATGKVALSNRLESLAIARPTTKPTRRLTMARLRYVGNWNPEPGAWPRMARITARYFHTRLNIIDHAIGPKLSPKRCPLAQMTGTGVFTLSAAQITALRYYIQHGGMLLADAAGGKNQFTDSFVQLVVQAFPHQTLIAVPQRSSLYTGTFPDGVNVTRVKYRKFYNQQHQHVKTRPELMGIKRNGRWIVVFSSADITCGLLGTNTWGISGYAPPSAQALAANVIMYAIAHR
jgi:hypothetical protein